MRTLGYVFCLLVTLLTGAVCHKPILHVASWLLHADKDVRK